MQAAEETAVVAGGDRTTVRLELSPRVASIAPVEARSVSPVEARSVSPVRVTGVTGSVLAGLGSIVPRFVRDGVYDFVARHRHKIIRADPSCLLPSPEQRARFIT